jgi:hypothetical protein
MTVAGPVNSMTFIRDSTVLACAIGNKIFLYKVNYNYHIELSNFEFYLSLIMVNI